MMEIAVSYDARGIAAVRSASGDILVGGNEVATIGLAVSEGGLLSFTLNQANLFQPMSGELAGLADAATHISNNIAGLNALAEQFSSTLNAAHEAGLDANGAAGLPLLNFTGAAAELVAFARAIAQVATANTTSNNGNMLAFNNLRGANGIEQNVIAFITQQAQATAAARAQEAASSGRRQSALAARDAIGGVDLDREATDLLRFQQAYEAAARTIQVARETMQTMLNIF